MPRYLWLRIAWCVAVIRRSPDPAPRVVRPAPQPINLGLDLQGGIHLVLGVDVDKAIENVVERTAGTCGRRWRRRASAPR